MRKKKQVKMNEPVLIFALLEMSQRTIAPLVAAVATRFSEEKRIKHMRHKTRWQLSHRATLTTNQTPINVICAVVEGLVTSTAQVIDFFKASFCHVQHLQGFKSGGWECWEAYNNHSWKSNWKKRCNLLTISTGNNSIRGVFVSTEAACGGPKTNHQAVGRREHN